MTPREEHQIAVWNDKLSHEIQIHLLITEDPRTKDLTEFCEQLSRLAPSVRVSRKDGVPGDLPAIQINPSLYYQAIPLETELPPFLDALGRQQEGTEYPAENLPDSIRAYLAQINMPMELSLYVSPHCPFCPAMVRQLLPLTSAAEFVRLTVIDGFLFQEKAQAHHIQSVPTLLLEDQFRWTGSVDVKEVAEMMSNRDPSQCSLAAMKRMLTEGNASQLARMMMESQTIFPLFPELLSHEQWHFRLGAMVAMEEIAEKDKQLASQVIQPLWEQFTGTTDQVRGDILYIFGETGNPEALSLLKTVLDGDYMPEVREAAAEAIEKITPCLS